VWVRVWMNDKSYTHPSTHHIHAHILRVF
jgi:hypothetical protein